MTAAPFRDLPVFRLYSIADVYFVKQQNGHLL